MSIGHSSLAELYVRPISKRQIAKWERNRRAYEQVSRAAAAKEFAVVRRVFRAVPTPKKPTKGYEYKPCMCGCGQPPSSDGAFYAKGHRPLRGTRRQTDGELRLQLSQIPDTELGQLAKKVLLKELGR